ncbi:MAG: hypothetical protein AAFV85_23190 [Cyanobacteria bacterium J06634_6]
MNILIPAPALGPTLLTLLSQQRSVVEFAQANGMDQEWLCTMYSDLLRGHQPTIMQGELKQLSEAFEQPLAEVMGDRSSPDTIAHPSNVLTARHHAGFFMPKNNRTLGNRGAVMEFLKIVTGFSLAQ